MDLKNKRQINLKYNVKIIWILSLYYINKKVKVVIRNNNNNNKIY